MFREQRVRASGQEVGLAILRDGVRALGQASFPVQGRALSPEAVPAVARAQ